MKNMQSSKLNAFYYFLKDLGLKTRTVDENVKDIERFITWAQQENYTDIPQMNYNELLSYVQHMKSRQLTVATINIRITSLRKYYEHLKQEGIIEKNPARHLRIKGQVQRITENPFTYAQLEELFSQYERYSRSLHYHYRNLSMLGLMIWQGAHSGELAAMNVEHIKLNEGIVYIPSTRRSNAREIKLDARQIITLHNYMKELPAQQEKLFEGSLRNWVVRLLEELKGLNPALRNLQHIRASVILHWIKMYDKRQVQYLVGHRYIGSTQYYEQQEMDTLTDILTKHHPFA